MTYHAAWKSYRSGSPLPLVSVPPSVDGCVHSGRFSNASIVIPLALLVFCLADAMPVRVIQAQRRASLSADLQLLVSRRSARPSRVIVHGDDDALNDLSRRHGVRVVRRLAHEAVVEANAADVQRLAADPAFAHLSGDLPGGSAMSVSNRSTGADRRAPALRGCSA